MSDPQELQRKIERFRSTIDQTRALLDEVRAAARQRKEEASRLAVETASIDRSPAVAPPPPASR